MKTIEVKTEKKYDALVGRELLDEAGKLISEVSRGEKIFLVSDSNVAGLYMERVEKSLSRAGFAVTSFVFPAGEENKTGETLLKMLGAMADSGLTRKDTAVALGGGVTGDLTGLGAAMYMRGIDYVQIPTSVLAAVDSSVGGKTAIDLPQGKNLAGAFHQPSLVIVDTEVFDTLPERDYNNGFAEVIKYGMIQDPEIIGMLGKRDKNGVCGRVDQDDMEDLIARCVGIKAAIVEEDEFESGKRQILNFGHTIGHAAEKMSGYSIYHGEAVALGMLIITEACVKSGECEENALTKLKEALALCDLPAKNPGETEELIKKAKENRERILEIIKVDKKNTGDGINVVIPKKTGECSIKKITTEGLVDLI